MKTGFTEHIEVKIFPNFLSALIRQLGSQQGFHSHKHPQLVAKEDAGFHM